MFELATSDWVTLAGTVISLVFLEGLLSADNALVLAVMVRHLPREQQKRALRYGIFGAFFFRFVAVLLASRILDYWQFEVVGGLYLLYLAVAHLLFDKDHAADPGNLEAEKAAEVEPESSAGFWKTVIGVELTDIAFSIDSILAAVALADGLPRHLQTVQIGPMGLKSVVIYVGGILGIITMRYVAGYFLILLERFPGLARGAYFLVGWIGIKLVGSGVHHGCFHGGEHLAEGWPRRLPVPESVLHHLEMPSWFFWVGMLLILGLSMALGPRRSSGVTETAGAGADGESSA